MHYVNKSVDVEASGFRVSAGRLIKCLPGNQLRPRRSRYSKGLLNYPLPKITSYSPVSGCNYKDFSLSTLMESIPKKSIKRRIGQGNDDLVRIKDNSSKLHTYAILPPVRKSADLIQEFIEKEAYGGEAYKGSGYSVKAYKQKVYLPVLYEHKMKNNESARENKEVPKPIIQITTKPTPLPKASNSPNPPIPTVTDDYLLNPWDYTDSQDYS